MKYIISILIMAAGTAITFYANWLTVQFGRIDFAEKYLGYEGGTRLFYRLLGVLIILLTLLYLSGILPILILDFFGPLFGGAKQ